MKIPEMPPPKPEDPLIKLAASSLRPRFVAYVLISGFVYAMTFFKNVPALPYDAELMFKLFSFTFMSALCVILLSLLGCDHDPRIIKWVILPTSLVVEGVMYAFSVFNHFFSMPVLALSFLWAIAASEITLTARFQARSPLLGA